MMRSALPSRIALRLEVGTTEAWVLGDPTQLEQVLLNLVVNGGDAIGEQPGEVSVTLTVEKSHTIRLVVQDNGSGIPPEVMDKVLEPFFSTKPQGEGTGLGLSTAYGIVLQHEGQLRLHSEPGHGTRVLIELPVTTDRARTSESSVPMEPRDSLDVLVVEDDSAVRTVMSRWLSSRGHRVTVAEDGQDALGVLDARNANFDVVVSDMVMTTVGGLQLLRQARDRWPNLRFLLTSGFAPDLEAIPSDVHFLAKPFRSQDLSEALQWVAEISG